MPKGKDQKAVEAPEKKEESNSDRFHRIAGGRTSRILHQLRLLGNCSNRYTYSYSDAEVEAMFNAIEAELERVRSLYKQSTTFNF